MISTLKWFNELILRCQNLACFGDILMDLLDQFLNAGKTLLIAQTLDKTQRDLTIIQILLEIQQMGFDMQGS